MITPDGEQRWQEIRDIRKEYRGFYEILGGIALVLIGILIGFAFFPGEADIGYKANVYTTLLGVLITVVVLDRRAEQRERERLKTQLIREMGVRDSSVTLRAVRELKAHNWLMDGSLRGGDFIFADLRNADLNKADLSDANLTSANLQQANLNNANLQEASLFEAELSKAKMLFCIMRKAKLEAAKLVEADLTGVDLRGAGLFRADLVRAHLGGANLETANLSFANLANASLRGANLRGAKLRDANLQGVELKETDFDEKTTLPDGSKWAHDSDMTRFTDAGSAIFWRSEKKRSPAYKSEAE